jgi:hypothetical protein
MATGLSERLVHSAHPAPFVRMLDKYFYFCMSLLILVLVTVMFSTTVPPGCSIRRSLRPTSCGCTGLSSTDGFCSSSCSRAW